MAGAAHAGLTSHHKGAEILVIYFAEFVVKSQPISRVSSQRGSGAVQIVLTTRNIWIEVVASIQTIYGV